MWVTQTYLGNLEPDAKLFVYYLFENYIREQVAFTEEVERHLEDLGQAFGESVSLLAPNPRYAVRIESEVREIEDFWWTLRGKLPALLISTKPLNKFDLKDGEYFLVSFDSPKPQKALLRPSRVSEKSQISISRGSLRTSPRNLRKLGGNGFSMLWN